jgi:sugar lactone lactonase YvrE
MGRSPPAGKGGRAPSGDQGGRGIVSEIIRVADCANILGEGPLWDGRAGALYWVDIKGKALWRHTPASRLTEHWPLPEEVCSLAVRERGGLVLALYGGFRYFDPARGALERIVDTAPDNPRVRMNDGKPDRRGRFWAGSIDNELIEPLGTLFRLDPDGSCHAIERGIICSNGLAFSPDDRTLYFADSKRELIWAYDLEIDSGRIGNRRVFAGPGSAPGLPDGATVDAEGYLWSARWGGWCIARFDPVGRLDRLIEVPMEQPSCPAFGGADLGLLYLTSARWRLSEAALSKQPLAGALCALEVGVKGLPEPCFKG